MQKIFSGLLLFFIISISILSAQEITVSGTVTSSDGEQLPGVTIRQKGTSVGVISAFDGSYRISVPVDATLLFSNVGFTSQEKKVMGNSQLDVVLIESMAQLDEVVVTALGIERETRNLGYKVQRIDSDLVADIKSPNFVQNLAGKLAGVTVTQGATGVGSTSKIVVRGEASFTNNNPLFVIDGTPVNNNTIVNFTNDAAAGFQEVDFGNGAMEINPDDIASVNVLKGPGAAVLYGNRGSNGVIVITTKDGSEQEGLGVSFSSSTFIDRAFQLPQFQNEYGQGNSGAFEFVNGLGGGTNDNISYSWGPRTDQGLLISQFDSPVNLPDGSIVRGGDVAVHGGLPISQTPFVSYPDNLKNFYRTGTTLINSVALSNKTGRGSYRISFTDLASESIIPGVNLDRETLTARLKFKPVNELEVNATISYINTQSLNRPSSGYGSENVNYSLVAWGPRSLNIDRLKDYWQPGLQNLQQYSFNYTFFDNPYFILQENRNSLDRDRVFGNLSARYFFTPNLSLLLRSGLDYSTEQRAFRRAFSTNRFRNGAYAVHDVSYREVNTDFLLNYRVDVNKLGLDFYVGGNQMEQQASTKQTQALSLAQPGVFRLSNAASPLEIFDRSATKKVNSLYAMLNLNYGDFAFLEFTGRNDWSSALATPQNADNVSFFYPSVSAALVPSELIEMPSIVSFFKLRGSWYQVGNDTGPYQTAGVFEASTPYAGLPTFTDQSTITNSALLPEKKTATEFGFVIGLLDQRIDVDFTYYNELTEDQIITLPVSIASGYTQQVVNGSKVRSKGLEVIVGANWINQTNLKWNTTFNFSRNVTSIEALPQGVDRLTLAYSRVYDNVSQTVFFQVEEGGRVGDMYGTGYLRNEQGEFIISEQGTFIADNRLQKLGNYNPDFMLGMQNSLAFKNWTWNMLWDWRQGGILVSRTLALAAVGGQLKETANRPDEGIVAQGVVRVGGTDENPVYEPNTTAISAETYYRNFYDRNHEENNTYNAGYLKLRELSIGYRFSGGFFKNGRSLNISIIGRNLFAFSEIPHFDPEQLAVQGQQFVNGVEDMSYATTRSFGVKIGLNL